MPGYKITMLPDEVVQTYTLDAGAQPTRRVSLYVTLRRGHAGPSRPPNHAPGAGAGARTTCATTSSTTSSPPNGWTTRRSRPKTRRKTCWACAEQLSLFVPPGPRTCKAQREVVRGKPENFTRPDYTFHLEGDERRRAHWHETGADRHPLARRAAGPDRGRGRDRGQQHLGPTGWPSTACPASTAARPAWRRASRCA